MCVGADSSHRSQHAGPSGEPVVDQDGDTVLGRFWGTAIPVCSLPSFDLLPFLFHCCVDYILRDAEFMDDGRIEGQRAIRSDGTHRQLCYARDPKFANDHDVEWEVQSERNFVSDRDATTRKAKDDSILATTPESRSQDGVPQGSTGVSAILKDLFSQEHSRLAGDPGPLGGHDGA
jgi:hypothetical protein